MDFELKDGLVRSFMLLIPGVVGFVFYWRIIYDLVLLALSIGLLMAGILFLVLALKGILPSYQKTSKAALIAFIVMNSILGSLVVFLPIFSTFPKILLAILLWTFVGYNLMHLIRKMRIEKDHPTLPYIWRE